MARASRATRAKIVTRARVPVKNLITKKPVKTCSQKNQLRPAHKKNS